ncbi:MAG: 3-hydroxybutyrate dehydrogenase [Gemmatimonadetes bacterium]|jgi:3-hydroxybutyrate dehydrogenase|nr:3-hydroxybutyrate dehydrogenase [Gemmatimonadota bacterium]
MKRVAIVTGAASGIGRAVAEALSREGHELVVADRDGEQGSAVAEQIGGLFVEVDLVERASCRRLVDTAVEAYGGVDILVNNAGFQHVSPLDEFPEDTWDDMIGVMLTAPFLLTRYVWPHMRERGWGRVVNMASIHGLVASANKIGYISAKHGLLGLTRTAALEGGEHGITVNAICPAYVRTPLVENQIAAQAEAHQIDESEVVEKILLESAAVKRLIEPEEIAGLVVYLCSELAASVTGAEWKIDGGWTAR